MSEPPVAVRLRGVAVDRGGERVWSQGTFDLPHGGVVGVIGPNGSGKTTLLELLVGLVEPSEGSVEVLGRTPQRGDRRIGYVPQRFGSTVADDVRCRDVVALGVTGTRWGIGLLTPAEREGVDRALAAVSADHLAGRRMSQLSGGQEQRIAIAQAVVSRPELLLLDEPLANLDLRSQQEIVSLLGELAAEHGLTVVVVVHDLNPLLPLLTSAVYLLDGHAHHDAIGEVVDPELLSHLYGTDVRVVRTAQGDLFTRGV